MMNTHSLTVWTVALVLFIGTGNSVANPEYETGRQSRIKLNLGLHVPPIIVKLPRLELPQLTIGANLIKRPHAKPLTIQLPPLPQISFGDSGGSGGGYGPPEATYTHAGGQNYEDQSSSATQPKTVKMSSSDGRPAQSDQSSPPADIGAHASSPVAIGVQRSPYDRSWPPVGASGVAQPPPMALVPDQPMRPMAFLPGPPPPAFGGPMPHHMSPDAHFSAGQANAFGALAFSVRPREVQSYYLPGASAGTESTSTVPQHTHLQSAMAPMATVDTGHSRPLKAGLRLWSRPSMSAPPVTAVRTKAMSPANAPVALEHPYPLDQPHPQEHHPSRPLIMSQSSAIMPADLIAPGNVIAMPAESLHFATHPSALAYHEGSMMEVPEDDYAKAYQAASRMPLRAMSSHVPHTHTAN